MPKVPSTRSSSSKASSSIQKGADFIVSLIENEKAQIVSEYHQKLQDLETQFAEYRNAAAEEYAKAIQRIKELEAAAGLSDHESSMAGAEARMQDALQEKTIDPIVQEDFGELRSSLAKIGVTHVETGTFKFDGEAAGIVADLLRESNRDARDFGGAMTEGEGNPDVSANIESTPFLMNIPSIVNLIKESLEAHKRAKTEWETQYRLVAAERDQLRKSVQISASEPTHLEENIPRH